MIFLIFLSKVCRMLQKISYGLKKERGNPRSFRLYQSNASITAVCRICCRTVRPRALGRRTEGKHEDLQAVLRWTVLLRWQKPCIPLPRRTLHPRRSWCFSASPSRPRSPKWRRYTGLPKADCFRPTLPGCKPMHPADAAICSAWPAVPSAAADRGLYRQAPALLARPASSNPCSFRRSKSNSICTTSSMAVHLQPPIVQSCYLRCFFYQYIPFLLKKQVKRLYFDNAKISPYPRKIPSACCFRGSRRDRAFQSG